MDTHYEKCLEVLDASHIRLASLVPPPKKVRAGKAFTFRYEEKSLEQALLQKLARLVTGLRAAQLLVRNGFLQEQVVLQRSLQEIEEDIFFLSFARIAGRLEKIHEQYLQAFFQEPEGSPFSVSDSKRLKAPQRPAIRDWIAGVEVPNSDVSESSKALRILYAVGSGYVHAASAQVMELYFGEPAKWQLRGSHNSPFYDDHNQDIWNYYYRAVLAFGFAAKAIGDDALALSLESFARDFASLVGKNFFATS